MTRILFIVALALLLAPATGDARRNRSRAARTTFQRQHPCPSTDSGRGACPGYVIDHRVALCVGGEDRADNMRWMTFDASLAKDRWECRPGWQGRLRDCEAAGCFAP